MIKELDGNSSGNQPEPISIVGVGCKLPGSITSVADLLSALREGRDCVTEIPPERWDLDLFYDPDPLTPGKSYVRHGGFVSDIDRFDAAFFGISDSEAARMDPQQRLLLETVWHALEDAGQSPDTLAKSNTGVFLAMMNTNSYAGLKAFYEGMGGTNGYDTMADAMSIAAGRISHFLDLQGPCFALDTACSGSMVALHQARQSILAGDCDTAIVAGVNMILHPGVHVAFSKVGLMSRSGRCRAFDEGADGYIRSEGCMAVVLRRQSVARARNDHILADILGTALTQDGRTPAVTAPNGQMQEKVIRLALARVGISPNEIGYVEAHGTGTPVGDPIEMSALVNVYGPGRSDQQPLFVGSAKSNFGHIELGAGLLGLVKTALSLDQGIIFPSLHFNRLNPNIDLHQAPVQVPTAPVQWPRGERPRTAGVNSFGFSGTNAHAILQEASAPADAGAQVRPQEIVVLSAKSPQSLQELVDKWTDLLGEDGGPELGDLAFTAATGRSHMRHRLAVVARNKNELSDKLHSWREGRMSRGLFAGQTALGRKPKIAYVFTGQGAQYAGMGSQLYQLEPRFKAAIDRCAALMDKDLGAPLLDVLFGSKSADYLNDTRYVQPALFAIEYALADLLRDWGLEPNYVIGHSVGEIVAACVAGAISFEGAVRFVLARGRLMGQLPRGGKMLAIDATPEQAKEWLAGHEANASIAGINGPFSVVVSGTAAAVDEVAKRATAAGRRSKQLEVSHAFHSPLMEPILKELEQAAASLRVAAGTIPVLSNVTGEILGEGVPASYWSAHVRQPVLFYQGMSKIIEAGCSVLIEIGPHPTLTPAIASAFDLKSARTIPTLMRDQQDGAHMLEALGALYVSGAPVNLDRAFWKPDYRRASLPLYPFRRDVHWLRDRLGIDVTAGSASTPAARPVHASLGRAMSVGSRRAVFEASVAAKQPWVDHRIMGSTVFPGTGYLEMAARGYAASKGADWQSVSLRNVAFERPLVLGYGEPKKVSIALEARATNGSAGESTFQITAAEDGKTETYCRGHAAAAGDRIDQVAVKAEIARMKSTMQIGPFYGDARKAGFEYGASFSTVRELWIGQAGSGEAIARLTVSPNADTPEDHPFRLSTVLDGSLQLIRAAAMTLDDSDAQGTYVPRSIRSATFIRELPFQMWGHVSVRAGEDRSILASVRLINDEGEVLAHIQDLDLRPMARLSLARRDQGSAPAERAALLSRAELVERLQKLPPPERVDVVSKWLIDEIKDILGQAAEEIDLDNIDASTAFLEIGLDSLLVTELQRRIQEKLEFRFKAMQGLDYQSIESLAQYIVKDVLVVGPAAAAALKPDARPAPAAERIA